MMKGPAKDPNAQTKRLRLIWLAVAPVFVWSAIRPHDYFTWLLEVLPAVIGAVILAATYRRFRFTTPVYVLIAALVSALTGSAGDAFLGTQGDVFDTQKDMAMALVGAVTALLAFSTLHDKQLALKN